jgi:sugar (pentulose or hexulose) kinase
VSATHYLAVDLGAESGRVMLGTLQDDQLMIEEIHRFPNRLLTANSHLHWDLDRGTPFADFRNQYRFVGRRLRSA